MKMLRGTSPKHDIEEIKRLITPIVSRYEVDRVYVFGSYARGEADEVSDIDMRIDVGKIRAFDFCGLLVRMEEALETKVDVVLTRNMCREFLESILADEILIYER